MAFRYPDDKQGNNYLEAFSHINLEFLAESLNEASWILEAVFMELNRLLEIKFSLQNH